MKSYKIHKNAHKTNLQNEKKNNHINIQKDINKIAEQRNEDWDTQFVDFNERERWTNVLIVVLLLLKWLILDKIEYCLFLYWFSESF